MFRSKKSADYHEEMNFDHYIEWWSNSLLPNIPASSAVVLDNASYHNKQKDRPPCKKTRKDVMKAWLDSKGIPHEATDLKEDLLAKIKQHHAQPIFLTGEVAHENGYIVLRLPVAHCELNPIELAWASVKGFVARGNQLHTLAEVEELTPFGFKYMTSAMWEKFCQHVVKVEEKYYKRDGIIKDMFEDFIHVIHVEDDDDDDDDHDDEEVDEEELMDSDDRRIINTALRQIGTSDQNGD